MKSAISFQLSATFNNKVICSGGRCQQSGVAKLGKSERLCDLFSNQVQGLNIVSNCLSYLSSVRSTPLRFKASPIWSALKLAQLQNARSGHCPHAPTLLNKKAQAETISFVLVTVIIVVLVLSSFIWGLGMVDDRKESYVAGRMKSSMLEMRDSVLDVLQEGDNATRMLSVNVDRGRLYLDNSSIPVSCGQQRRDNGIIFEAETKAELVSSKTWINVDPYENETGDLCTVGGPSLNSPAVLFARSADSQGEKGKYLTQYLLSFRNLKDISTAEGHIVRIGSSTIGQNSTGVGEGSHKIMVRNEGSTYDASSTRWTHNIAIIFDP